MAAPPVEVDVTGSWPIWRGYLPDDAWLQRLFLYHLDGQIYGVWPRYRGEGDRTLVYWYTPLTPETEPSHAYALNRGGWWRGYNALKHRQPEVAAAVPATVAAWEHLQAQLDEQDQAYWSRALRTDVNDALDSAAEAAKAAAREAGRVVGGALLTGALVLGGWKFLAWAIDRQDRQTSRGR